jgi:hypothetical protein
VKLERYNQVVFALLGTGLLFGGLVLTVFLALSAVRSRPHPGVIVDGRNVQRPLQNLVFCPPVTDETGTHQYIPVGVVVASDADQDAVLRMGRSSSYKESYVGACNIHEHGGASRIFNVVVRNLRTGEQRLLLSRPGQIDSLRIPDARCALGEGESPCGVLLWKIRSEDTNKDGRINYDDALVAYISDLSAHALRPMTPAEATTITAKWTPKAGKWHFQIRRDANSDGRYTEEDGSELLEAGVETPARAAAFIEESLMQRLREAAK